MERQAQAPHYMTPRAKRLTLAYIIGLLIVAACGRSDPKMLLLGQWKEDMKTEKWDKILADTRIRERMIHFFPDGTAVEKTAYDDPSLSRTRTFTWSLSEDGKILKTEDKELGRVVGQDASVYTAHIALLTKKELKIDEPSSANGHFERIE